MISCIHKFFCSITCPYAKSWPIIFLLHYYWRTNDFQPRIFLTFELDMGSCNFPVRAVHKICYLSTKKALTFTKPKRCKCIQKCFWSISSGCDQIHIEIQIQKIQIQIYFWSSDVHRSRSPAISYGCNLSPTRCASENKSNHWGMSAQGFTLIPSDFPDYPVEYIQKAQNHDRK